MDLSNGKVNEAQNERLVQVLNHLLRYAVKTTFLIDNIPILEPAKDVGHITRQCNTDYANKVWDFKEYHSVLKLVFRDIISCQEQNLTWSNAPIRIPRLGIAIKLIQANRNRFFTDMPLDHIFLNQELPLEAEPSLFLVEPFLLFEGSAGVLAPLPLGEDLLASSSGVSSESLAAEILTAHSIPLVPPQPSQAT